MSKNSGLSREQLQLVKLLEQPENKLCADCSVRGEQQLPKERESLRARLQQLACVAARELLCCAVA
jgi:hypothetical protein